VMQLSSVKPSNSPSDALLNEAVGVAPAEARDRLQAADGLIARDLDEGEEDEFDGDSE